MSLFDLGNNISATASSGETDGFSSGKKIIGIGVNFNSTERQIDDWVEVDLL